jgi:hypothetical protein
LLAVQRIGAVRLFGVDNPVKTKKLCECATLASLDGVSKYSQIGMVNCLTHFGQEIKDVGVVVENGPFCHIIVK